MAAALPRRVGGQTAGQGAPTGSDKQSPEPPAGAGMLLEWSKAQQLAF